MPIIVGGTHYYIESVVYKILVEPMDDEEALLWDVSRTKRSLEDDDNRNRKKIATENQATASDKDETEVEKEQVQGELSKEKIQEIFDNENNFTKTEIHDTLKAIDPVMASRHHPNNRRKVLR